MRRLPASRQCAAARHGVGFQVLSTFSIRCTCVNDSDFVPGQRWVSDTEASLGLGTVVAVEPRRVTLHYAAAAETRTYARHEAPLTRARYAPGDRVRDAQGAWLRVDTVTLRQGLLHYHGTRADGVAATLGENDLDSSLQLNRPLERLLSGRIDADAWFELRYRTRLQVQRLAASDLHGLMGARTRLIPHQLYIAHEVAQRYAPRVLLADEVGLGKTIEAGMILHHQLLTERAQRVLVVVPDSLVHQWLVEMLRRFNLRFSVFDEERCQALAGDGTTPADNPFATEQLILCSLDFLVTRADRFHQALACPWDLLVVDEAHHLRWTETEASVEYQYMEQLAQATRGVILLSATPEQLGAAGHYARLRLLDPGRFPRLDAFLAETRAYEPVARAVETLLDGRPLDAATLDTLRATLAEGDNQAWLDRLQQTDAMPAAAQHARAQLVEHLLDRHGTGRVLFRNTRATVHGFPIRHVALIPLPLPDAYAECLRPYQAIGSLPVPQLLTPERIYSAQARRVDTHWTRIDPRIPWLCDQLKQLRPTKVLVIAAHAQTAMDIAAALRTQVGIHAALFHEHMTLLERDRAAAFFADPEGGTPVLVCSEIGSEGRNFQFAHHLVLFDLPLDPDLLEQRIGRLDRIGQGAVIHVHVPYLRDSAQEIMARWYHEGLDAYRHTCPAGQSVYTKVATSLEAALHQTDDGLEDLPALLTVTRRVHQDLRAALQRGRDRLLEYHSCRPPVAARLCALAESLDAASDVLDYLDAVFDCYGIEMQPHRAASYSVVPGVHPHGDSFPGLPPDGVTITADRATALANEDWQFVNWEHPLVTGAMDLVLSEPQGNCACTALRDAGVTPGTLLLECIFVLEGVSPVSLQAARYLPPTTLRVVIDPKGRDHHAVLTPERLARDRQAMDADTTRRIVGAYVAELKHLAALAEQQARRQVPALLAAAQAQAEPTLLGEARRLRALRAVNPNVRPEEIAYFESQWQALTAAVERAELRLDGVRVIAIIG
jgi:ATP-dependent helicase HepA